MNEGVKNRGLSVSFSDFILGGRRHVIEIERTAKAKSTYQG